MTFLDDDLTSLLADTGFTVAVSIGASSTRGYFDWADTTKQDTSGFDVFVRTRTVLIQTGSLTGLVTGAAIVVDGTTFRVHDTSHEDDGKLTRVTVA